MRKRNDDFGADEDHRVGLGAAVQRPAVRYQGTYATRLHGKLPEEQFRFFLWLMQFTVDSSQ